MSEINKLERIVLRADTRRRDLWGMIGGGSGRKQLVQMHVMKTAGSTFMRHFVSCFGSYKNGAGVLLHDNKYEQQPPKETIAAAKTARYVTGHISWNLMRQVSTEGSSYVFTVLRSPVGRVRSLYEFLSTPVMDGYHEHRKRLHAKMQNLTPIEFLRTDDPELRYLFDNVLVRQFSGGFDQFPVNRETGPRLLDTAIEHLQQLDHVAFSDSLDFDVKTIMRANNLPWRGRVAKVNTTARLKERSGHWPRENKKWGEDADEIAHALLHWDNQVFKFAASQRRT